MKNGMYVDVPKGIVGADNDVQRIYTVCGEHFRIYLSPYFRPPNERTGNYLSKNEAYLLSSPEVTYYQKEERFGFIHLSYLKVENCLFEIQASSLCFQLSDLIKVSISCKLSTQYDDVYAVVCQMNEIISEVRDTLKETIDSIHWYIEVNKLEQMVNMATCPTALYLCNRAFPVAVNSSFLDLQSSLGDRLDSTVCQLANEAGINETKRSAHMLTLPNTDLVFDCHCIKYQLQNNELAFLLELIPFEKEYVQMRIQELAIRQRIYGMDC